MPRSTVHAVTAIGYGQDHSSHGRPRFARCHCGAREGFARAHCIEACEPATLPIGIEARDGTHHVARELAALGHDVKQVPRTYAMPYRQGA
jgi:transposase